MKILVIGGAGRSSSRIVSSIKSSGVSFWVYDNLSSGLRSHLPADIRFILGDTKDSLMLDRIFKDFKPELVVFNAWMSDQGPDPFLSFENNFLGVIHLLKACKKTEQVKELVVIAESDSVSKNQFEILQQSLQSYLPASIHQSWLGHHEALTFIQSKVHEAK